MKRLVVFVYGLACYAAFFATYLYAVGFLENFGVTKSIDSGPQVPLWQALLVDSALLALFAVQHSVMARPWFKKAWTQIVPTEAERSTYVLFSSAALAFLFWQWQPIGGTLWDMMGTMGQYLMWGGFAMGNVIILASTFLINHFDLFGLRQVWLYLRGREYTHLPFATPFFYKYVRHPLYVGWLLVFWCTPVMTAAHLLFAMMTTACILMAIRWEERDLITVHGENYTRYQKSVPMLIPTAKAPEPRMTAAAR
ncbi:MAG: isoprenylcysteine carboxylmethyltransferase family protein [Bryobacterales bacterium]|nr:isoprenylcysteine carboxylmethyltransferase family protein [Bryobacterales bacterium]